MAKMTGYNGYNGYKIANMPSDPCANNKKKSHYQKKLLRYFIKTLRCFKKKYYLCRVINVMSMETRYAKNLIGGGKSLIINHISALCSVADCLYITLCRANAVIALALLFCLCACTKDYEPQPSSPTGVRSAQDSTHTEGITITIDTTWDEPINTEF